MTLVSSMPMQMSGWKVSDISEKLDLPMAHELLSSLLGVRLGRGISREVFVREFDESMVIKIEDLEKGYFANVAEFQIWNQVVGTPYARWFAPSRSLSLGGRLLMQARTLPPAIRDLPAEIPAIFSDVKIENFGMYEGRLVCHDYAFLSNRFFSKKVRMRKASWA